MSLFRKDIFLLLLNFQTMKDGAFNRMPFDACGRDISINRVNPLDARAAPMV
jgi:hypothetical protein